MALLQDAAAQSDGSVPLIPTASAPAASAKMAASGSLRSGYDSSDSDQAEVDGENGRAANGLTTTACEMVSTLAAQRM